MFFIVAYCLKESEILSTELPRTKSIGAWFESVQNKPSPKKGGLIWTRDTKSPFHERIQKTKSIYEGKMNQDKTVEAASTNVPEKSRISSSETSN